MNELNNTNETTTSSISSGKTLTENEQDISTLPNSRRSETPVSASKKRWRSPESVKDFTAQAAKVATMLLNGDLDLDTVRAYSTIARTVAQSISAEVQRARFIKQCADLGIDTDNAYNADVDDWEDS